MTGRKAHPAACAGGARRLRRALACSLAALAAVACDPAGVPGEAASAARDTARPRTTDGELALTNLGATIDGLARRAADGDDAARRELVPHLLTRFAITARFDDLRRASEVADGMAAEAPRDASVLRLRARVRDTRHDVVGARADRAAALALERSRADGPPEPAAWPPADLVSAGSDPERMEALDALERSLDTTSPFPFAWIEQERAVLLEARGDTEGATEALERALERVPHHVAPAVRLARIERERGRLARAVALLERAGERSDDPRIRWMLADLHARAGRHDAADAARRAGDAAFERHALALPDVMLPLAADFFANEPESAPRRGSFSAP